jgi:glyoxylase-like metal-dependent hydrolase (beta-lactamase superfamily II)
MADEIPFKTNMQFEYGVPSVVAPGIRRIVAKNPSPFTFKGTNTYLVGGGRELAVIDPGPGDRAHLEAIMLAAGSARITHILLTHTHHDHSEGLPALKARTGAKTAGFGPTKAKRGSSERSPSGGEFVDRDFKPDVRLQDGGRLATAGVTLEALHTPGHAPDHLCFHLAGTPILFSGDHVMSWNTSVIAPPEGNMAAYMRSLDKLTGRSDELFLPGHGEALEQPGRVVRAFIVHRQMRETAILEAIRNGADTIPRIVEIVYRGLDPRLVNAARLSCLAHVERLVELGQVSSAGGPPSLERALAASSA